MAEGLTKKILGKKAHVESAGISSSFESAAIESIETMKRDYGINISAHIPRAVSQIDLNAFDRIIALDSYVERQLKSYQVPSERLITWNIEDPFGQGIEVYRECARKIKKKIDELHILV